MGVRRTEGLRGTGRTTRQLTEAIELAVKTRSNVYFIHGQDKRMIVLMAQKCYMKLDLRAAHYQPTYSRICLRPDDRGNDAMLTFIHVEKAGHQEMSDSIYRRTGLRVGLKLTGANTVWDHWLTEDD